ncbi:hypothetical protein YB2330_001570 [Saitoella coloradoensis]
MDLSSILNAETKRPPERTPEQTRHSRTASTASCPLPIRSHGRDRGRESPLRSPVALSDGASLRLRTPSPTHSDYSAGQRGERRTESVPYPDDHDHDLPRRKRTRVVDEELRALEVGSGEDEEESNSEEEEEDTAGEDEGDDEPIVDGDHTPRRASHQETESRNPFSNPANADKKGALPKVYACQHCGKAFARRSDLTRHERIHSGVRPYPCPHPTCGKSFIQRSALTVHLRVHTGEKPHACDFCDKVFADSSSLARHRRTHSGRRPYTCERPGCGRTFTRRTTLIRHLEAHDDQDRRDTRRRYEGFGEMVPPAEAMSVHTGSPTTTWSSSMPSPSVLQFEGGGHRRTLSSVSATGPPPPPHWGTPMMQPRSRTPPLPGITEWSHSPELRHTGFGRATPPAHFRQYSGPSALPDYSPSMGYTSSRYRPGDRIGQDAPMSAPQGYGHGYGYQQGPPPERFPQDISPPMLQGYEGYQQGLQPIPSTFRFPGPSPFGSAGGHPPSPLASRLPPPPLRGFREQPPSLPPLQSFGGGAHPPPLQAMEPRELDDEERAAAATITGLGFTNVRFGDRNDRTMRR